MDRQAGRRNDVTNGQTEYAYVKGEIWREKEKAPLLNVCSNKRAKKQ